MMTDSINYKLAIIAIAAILLIPNGAALGTHINTGTEISEEIYVDEQYVIRGEEGNDELYGDITNDFLYG